MYRYHTGEMVQLGDVISYPGFGKGHVSRVLCPKTEEAIAWGLPDGAVIGGFGGSEASISFDNPEEEEDLEFLSRGTLSRQFTPDSGDDGSNRQEER